MVPTLANVMLNTLAEKVSKENAALVTRKDDEGRARRTMDLGSLRRHLKLGPRLSRAWQEMEQITIGAIEGFCPQATNGDRLLLPGRQGERLLEPLERLPRRFTALPSDL